MVLIFFRIWSRIEERQDALEVPCFSSWAVGEALDWTALFYPLSSAASGERTKKCVAWDSEKRLSFAVPFREMKPVIYLDVFLPRVTELALSASDRQTKVFVLSFIFFIVYCFKNMYVLVKKQILYFSNSSVVTFQIF